MVSAPHSEMIPPSNHTSITAPTPPASAAIMLQTPRVRGRGSAPAAGAVAREGNASGGRCHGFGCQAGSQPVGRDPRETSPRSTHSMVLNDGLALVRLLESRQRQLAISSE